MMMINRKGLNVWDISAPRLTRVTVLVALQLRQLMLCEESGHATHRTTHVDADRDHPQTDRPPALWRPIDL